MSYAKRGGNKPGAKSKPDAPAESAGSTEKLVQKVRDEDEALQWLPPLPPPGKGAFDDLAVIHPLPLPAADCVMGRRPADMPLHFVKFDDMWNPLGVYDFTKIKSPKFDDEGYICDEKMQRIPDDQLPHLPYDFSLEPVKNTASPTFSINYRPKNSHVSAASTFASPPCRATRFTFENWMGKGKHDRQAAEASAKKREYNATKAQFSFPLCCLAATADQEIKEGPNKGLNKHYVSFMRNYRKIFLWAVRVGLCNPDRFEFSWRTRSMSAETVAKMAPMDLWCMIRNDLNIHTKKAKDEHGNPTAAAAARLEVDEIQQENPAAYQMYQGAPAFVGLEESEKQLGSYRPFSTHPWARVIEAMYDVKYNIGAVPVYLWQRDKAGKMVPIMLDEYQRQNQKILTGGAVVTSVFSLWLKPKNTAESKQAMTILTLKSRSTVISGRSSLVNNPFDVRAVEDNAADEYEAMLEEQERLAAEAARAADEVVPPSPGGSQGVKRKDPTEKLVDGLVSEDFDEEPATIPPNPEGNKFKIPKMDEEEEEEERPKHEMPVYLQPQTAKKPSKAARMGVADDGFHQ